MSTKSKYMKLKLAQERIHRRDRGAEPEQDVYGVSQDVLTYIKRKGVDGLNEQEIYDCCKRYRWMTKEGRLKAIQTLFNSGEIEQAQRQRGIKNKRGPLKTVWVATKGEAL